MKKLLLAIATIACLWAPSANAVWIIQPIPHDRTFEFELYWGPNFGFLFWDYWIDPDFDNHAWAIDVKIPSPTRLEGFFVWEPYGIASFFVFDFPSAYHDAQKSFSGDLPLSVTPTYAGYGAKFVYGPGTLSTVPESNINLAWLGLLLVGIGTANFLSKNVGERRK
jgi:hypothetical protein